MTEQELREQFESKRKGDDFSTILLCGQKAYWNKTIQRDWEIFKDGHSLAQETIKAKDAEIEKLKSDYYYRQYLGRQTIKDENKRIYSILEQKEKAITEAIGLIEFAIKESKESKDQRERHQVDFDDLMEFEEKAKAWLEINKWNTITFYMQYCANY